LPETEPEDRRPAVVPTDASVTAATTPPNAAASGICADLGLSLRFTLTRNDPLELHEPDGYTRLYQTVLERDLNDDGHDDLVLFSTDGCSRSGGCLMYVFANCGDDTYAEAAGFGYAKGVESAAKDRTQGWLDLWVITGDRVPRKPDCFLEVRTLFQWNGQSYRETKRSTEKQKC
jgi:hypothetical protein